MVRLQMVKERGNSAEHDCCEPPLQDLCERAHIYTCDITGLRELKPVMASFPASSMSGCVLRCITSFRNESRSDPSSSALVTRKQTYSIQEFKLKMRRDR